MTDNQTTEAKKSRFHVSVLRIVLMLVIIIAMVGITLSAIVADADVKLMKNELRNAEAIQIAKNNRNSIVNAHISRVAVVITKMQPRVDPDLAKLIARSVIAENKRSGIKASLILGVMLVESRFNPLAVSSANATGLMQVRYSVWGEQPELVDNGVTKEQHLFWVDANTKCGTTILKKYLEKANGDLAAALYRYNTGGTLGNKADTSYINNVIQAAYQAANLLGCE